MSQGSNNSYKEAGVDVEAGYRSVELMKKHVQSTYTEGVVSDIGGFGGLFAPNLAGIKEPILVSGTDGVGTKLKLAFTLDKHDTIGQDCVAMCVNDIICSGARPLFFLDYLAMSKNIPEKVSEIVKGVADGCKLAGCALIGGETAEMPGFYSEGEYDLAGFAVGVVDKSKIISPDNINVGDKVIGLASSGVHSNGFSLIRKIFSEDSLKGSILGIGGTLLTPTRIYVKPVLDLLSHVEVKGIANITGGGFYENLPRMLKDGFGVKIFKRSFITPYIFKLIQANGNIPEDDMYSTFNMGIGMAIIVNNSVKDFDAVHYILNGYGIKSWIIGEITEGNKEVTIV